MGISGFDFSIFPGTLRKKTSLMGLIRDVVLEDESIKWMDKVWMIIPSGYLK